MFYQKLALAITLSSSFLAFSPSSSAKSAFTEKYAPYIGYQHGYSSYYDWNKKIDTKYTPRFFMGISPIQGYNYKMGVEIGYTLPASYKNEYHYYAYWDKEDKHIQNSINVKNTDLYLTYYRRLTPNSHWFLKPGVEYYHRAFHRYENGEYQDWAEHHYNSVYVGAKAGAGYNFNKNLGINAVAGSRFYDFTRHDGRPIKFTFNINAEYAF